MIRGTTATNVFDIDADLSGAEIVYISYEQGGQVVVEKKSTDDGVEITADSVKVALTQKDTLAFKTSMPVRIQLRARFSDGSAIASCIIKTNVGEILKDGEI